MPRRKAAIFSADTPHSRPSIVAVAQEAKVSIATVSRVLNGLHTVKPELVRRVRTAIERTGYLPNVSARSLSSGRSRLFGVIISDLTNPFFPELLQSFEEFAVALGYEVLVASTAYDLQKMDQCIDRMLERKVDGVAIMTFGIEGPLLSRFVNRGVPLVFMDQAPKSESAFAIEVDYQAGIHEAVQHLAVLGHRRIAFIAGPQQQISVAHRKNAFDHALRHIGIAYREELIYSGDHSLESGERAFHAFMALAESPTAIMCSNDLSAIGVMRAAAEAGIRIPADLSLIGFDGIEMGAFMTPPLTSVVMSRREIAEAAVRTLWLQIEGNQTKPVCLNTRLLVRRTTTIPTGTLKDLTGISLKMGSLHQTSKIVR